MKKIMCLGVLAVLMLSGCMKGNDTENTAYNLRDDNTNPNFMSNGVNQDMGPMSDQNPNFLNLRGTAMNDASNRNNTGRDIDIARDIVNESDDFRAESIWINNGDNRMTVTVDTEGELNGQVRNKAVNTLRAKLQQALPRYSFQIRER
ncbi:hypothetical protein MLOOGBEN_09650 [Bacillus sp. EB106-08-02-XG196]|uniref:hypothetical protein n=1 Tax=Bacillus sp. EB106-08-02-XG196 TaxID=2737049 RepID=UPI0015C42ADF|nr:hypothetical protein [Bacillus sp. EB106-08-02-XG196]NWQ40958.1 hypothetical protein [Bacillus sp. EB106-08-02-XG196]